MPRSVPPKRPRLTPRDLLELLWELRREVDESPTLRPTDVLPRVARVLARTFADYCVVELAGPNGRLELNSVVHADQKRRHGLAALASSGDLGVIAAKLGARSRLVVPVSVEDEPVGALTLLNAGGESSFDRHDARFARELSALLALLLARPRASEPGFSTTSGVVAKPNVRATPTARAGRPGRRG